MAKTLYLMNGTDGETKRWAERLTVNPQYDRAPVIGGEKALGQVSAKSVLALMAHGTAELAVVVKEGAKRRWTPKEMAEQLLADGLGKDHHEIELLVCEAGASVNTAEGAKKLEELRQKYLAEKNEAKKALIRKEFEALEKSAPSLAPSATFVDDRSAQPWRTDYSQWNAGWLLPLGAAFVQELKKLDYTNIHVVSYRYPVSAHFNQGVVWLLDPEEGDRKASDADKVRWL